MFYLDIIIIILLAISAIEDYRTGYITDIYSGLLCFVCILHSIFSGAIYIPIFIALILVAILTTKNEIFARFGSADLILLLGMFARFEIFNFTVFMLILGFVACIFYLIEYTFIKKMYKETHGQINLAPCVLITFTIILISNFDISNYIIF